MGQLSQSLIIFLCIFGAACATVLGYAVHRFYSGKKVDDTEEEFNQRRTEQDQYMAELRDKHRGEIIMDLRMDRRAERKDAVRYTYSESAMSPGP